ncbi:hypothetical protein [Pedobacter terrae]|uniref:hypothetical protein n=1 Tax=Pedobacter terrae TaxID=405671 RepID=UPI002FFB1DC4
MGDLSKLENSEIAAGIKEKNIVGLLDAIGLPSDNIIATDEARAIINKNLPELIFNLPDEVKHDARYLSKYVVGAGFGLFDYSLNAIWNEVTLALRKKAIAYGLDMFYDAAVGANIRASYATEEDLSGIKDRTLLDASKKLELIGDTTYKKLCHILDMRNDIGISHPTNAVINAYELLGWLTTCVKEVLHDQPSDRAIQIKGFVDNFKNHAVVLDQNTLDSVIPELNKLNSHQCSRILQTFFGLYIDSQTTTTLRKNISLLAPTLWSNSNEALKRKLGITLQGYKTNLHVYKLEKASEFFDLVQGNNFLPKSEVISALSGLVDDLESAHSGYDNYYYEYPIITKIMTFIDSPKDLPVEIAEELIDIITRCRIGRGYNYENGVSPKSKPLYEKFFSLMREDFLPAFFALITKIKVRTKLRNSISINQFMQILKQLRSTAVTPKYQEVLDYLITNIPKDSEAMMTSEYKKITGSFITW